MLNVLVILTHRHTPTLPHQIQLKIALHSLTWIEWMLNVLWLCMRSISLRCQRHWHEGTCASHNHLWNIECVISSYISASDQNTLETMNHSTSTMRQRMTERQQLSNDGQQKNVNKSPFIGFIICEMSVPSSPLRYQGHIDMIRSTVVWSLHFFFSRRGLMHSFGSGIDEMRQAATTELIRKYRVPKRK